MDQAKTDPEISEQRCNTWRTFNHSNGGLIMATEINGRKILFENEMCRSVGTMATCNCCDRIIFEDEMTAEEYTANHGYCKECNNETEEE